MKRWTNFLRGSVRLRVTGPFPERFVNICGANGVGFWRLRWEDGETLTLTIPRSCLRRAKALGPKAMCQVEELGRFGAPAWAERFRRRYAFLAGLALSIGAVAVLSHVVMVVEVTGNETVPTAEIVEELRQAGLKPGVFGPAVRARSVAHQVLMIDDRLCYMAVNLHGIRAEVIVREAEPIPELYDEDAPPGDIVAAIPGMIVQVEAMAGSAAVKAGDVVAAGDVLISRDISVIDPRTEETIYTKQVCATGSVYARTWRTLSASCPLEQEKKVYTGEKMRRRRFIFLDHCVNFYRNGGISYDRYDKITSTHQLILPGGLELPIWWISEAYQEYTTETVTMDAEAWQGVLEENLTDQLWQLLGDEGTICQTEFSAETKDGVLTVTLRAECLEQIGQQGESAP